MNNFLSVFFLCAIALAACKQQPSEDQTASDPDESAASPNQVLYEEVMDIHDEVMPKMDDIMRKKEELKNKIATNPNMSESNKQAIDGMILRLDSAGDGMMDWMHEFNPLPDSVGEDQAREYLENEMEKIKKVRENILQALQEAEKM